MPTYKVVSEYPDEDEFGTGVVLGTVNAPNPEAAIVEVSKMMLSDDLVDMMADEDSWTEEIVDTMVTMFSHETKDQGFIPDLSQMELVVYEVTHRHPRHELQLGE